MTFAILCIQFCTAIPFFKRTYSCRQSHYALEIQAQTLPTYHVKMTIISSTKISSMLKIVILGVGPIAPGTNHQKHQYRYYCTI